ncbi:hypothetical protein QJQ45_014563 [Haematococcus lacustris]|jgi:hypothetical protein
MPTL